jgi:hypothetical protein
VFLGARSEATGYRGLGRNTARSDDIRLDLWSHLQIEDKLMFAWGEAHHAISSTMLNTLGAERQELGEFSLSHNGRLMLRKRKQHMRPRGVVRRFST